MRETRPNRFSRFWSLLLSLTAISGCGGGPSQSATPVVSISISPASGSVQTSGSLQFSATVSGSANLSVIWQVNGSTGGAVSTGAISPSGLYTSPSSLPTPSTVTVTAISGADSTKSASATVAIVLPPISVTVSPSTASIVTLHTQQFTASVLNTSNIAVSWSVNGTVGGSSSTGTISTSGLYTAPSLVPTPNPVVIAAVSSADPSKSAAATVTVLVPPISVTTGPSAASVITLHTQQFAVTVANTSNTAVTWSVNGTVGGSSQIGTVSTSGLYTAPQSVPSSPVVSVSATSVADGTKSSTSQVTIMPPPVPTGTWSYLGPAGATDPAQIVTDPSNAQTMYITPAHGGIFKTTNIGQSWSTIIPSTGFQLSLIVAPATGTLYVFSEKQFQTSVDGGKTFASPVAYPNSVDTEVTAMTLAVDPNNDQTIYLLTSTALMRSKDGGATWTTLTGPPNPYIVGGVQAPTFGFLSVLSGNSSVLMSSSTTGFAISKDGGLTWQLQNNGLQISYSYIRQVVQDKNNPSRVLCVGTYSGPLSPTQNAQAYLSTDGGLTWTTVGTIGVSDRLLPNQPGPGIYGLLSGQVYVTFDLEANWKNIGPPTDNTGYTAVPSTVSPLNMAYQGSNDIFVSQDGGLTWIVSQTGINSRVMGQVAFAGTTTGPLYAATLDPVYFLGSSSSSTQLWRTPDPSQPWVREVDAHSNLPIVQFDVDPQNPLHLVGLEQASGVPTSVISTDGGTTWTSVPYAAGMANGFPAFQYSGVRFGASGSNSAFACGMFGLARLSTITNVWTIINTGIPSGATCTSVGVDQASTGTVYASTSSGVYKSTNAGNSWSPITAGTGYVSILVDPGNSNNVFFSAALGSPSSSSRSTDGGKTWSTMAADGMMAFNPANRSIMYAVDQNYLYASYDSGLTWSGIKSPIPFLGALLSG